jgi:hypothetical protein
MMITLEKATQKSMTRPFLSVYHTSFFLWALPQELVARPPTVLWLIGEPARLSWRSRPPGHSLPEALWRGSSRRRDRGGRSHARATRWSHPRSAGFYPKAASHGCLAGAQSTPRGLPSVSTIVERLMPLSPGPPGFSRLLAATLSLCDVAVHRDIGELEADGSAVGFERHLLQSVHQRPASIHCHAFSTQRGSRTRAVGYPPE